MTEEVAVREMLRKIVPGKVWLREQPRKRYVMDINVTELERLLYLNRLYTGPVVKIQVSGTCFFSYFSSLSPWSTTPPWTHFLT